MPRVIAALLRHGDYHQLENTPSAWQPFQLTETGLEQAKRSVSLLQGALQMFNWHLCPVIDSSQLLRGWQTADIICEGLATTLSSPITIESFDELAERSLGSAANLTLQQIESIIELDSSLQ